MGKHPGLYVCGFLVVIIIVSVFSSGAEGRHQWIQERRVHYRSIHEALTRIPQQTPASLPAKVTEFLRVSGSSVMFSTGFHFENVHGIVL